MRNSFGADLKIIVVGNPGTGKTSFVNKWTRGSFSDIYRPTIVSEFGYKIVNKENAIYRIQLWDLAGQDRNTYITKIFCKDSHASVILCEAGNEVSRAETLKWKNAINENTKFFDDSDIPIMLIENKSDLLKEPNFGYDELKSFSQKNNFLECFQTSVKNDSNVNESMDFLISTIIHKLKYIDRESIKSHKRMQEVNDSVILGKRTRNNSEGNFKKKNSCC